MSHTQTQYAYKHLFFEDKISGFYLDFNKAWQQIRFLLQKQYRDNFGKYNLLFCQRALDAMRIWWSRMLLNLEN